MQRLIYMILLLSFMQSTFLFFDKLDAFQIEEILMSKSAINSFRNVLTNKNGRIAWIHPECTNSGLTYSVPKEDAILYFLSQEGFLEEVSIRDLIIEAGYTFRNIKGVIIYDITDNDSIIMGVSFNYQQTEKVNNCSYENSDVVLFIGNKKKGFNHLLLDIFSILPVLYCKNGIFQIGNKKIIRVVDISNEEETQLRDNSFVFKK